MRFQMRYKFPPRSVSKSAIVTLSTPGAPLLAFTCRYASQTSHLEISNDFPADFSLSMQFLPDSFPVDPRTTPQMTRPLGSTPTALSRDFSATTSRSASTPQIGTQSLTGSSPLGTLPLAAPNTQGRQYQGMPSHVPCESSRSDSRRLHAGHRPASQRPSAGLLPRHSRFALVLMSPITSNDTSTAIPNIGTAHRLPDPHLTQSSAPFPCRSPRRSSANAAHGGFCLL